MLQGLQLESTVDVDDSMLDLDSVVDCMPDLKLDVCTQFANCNMKTQNKINIRLIETLHNLFLQKTF